ncbi:MAG TPA: hypothetical protein VKQ34_00015 [Candidatus Saccharimonadales bacterium]|nr:hypothetical protein [Candidatus Saccharimonadales bacterium]
MWAFAAVVAVFLILVFAEYLSRYKGVHSELTRKLVHILVGAFVAFWPFFLSWRAIQLLSVAFLIVVLVSVKLNIFGSIHAVKRNALGEILFALVIGILALIANTKWVFAAAMLNLSVADGLAAVVGLAFGDGSTYRVFGRRKSVAGSLAFFFASLAIMVGYAAFSGASYSAVTIIWLPALAAIAENLAVQGTDNLVIPLLVALVLTSSL